MYEKLLLIFTVFMLKLNEAQVVQFGTCVDVKTKEFFSLEKFLGKWYEIERYPTWYEDLGKCAYKHIQACGRRIEFEHVFVRDGIEFVLHVNSSYIAGDDAIFEVKENNIDPLGIPLKVIATDYTNYAVVYGCKNQTLLERRYVTAWILSRDRTLAPELREEARGELRSIKYAGTAYLQTVEQSEDQCQYHWSAHVQALDQTEEGEKLNRI